MSKQPSLPYLYNVLNITKALLNENKNKLHVKTKQYNIQSQELV